MVVDLSHCDYLDSTFLGCLVSLHRTYNRTSPHRFQVAASCDQRQKLLAPTHLDHLLDLTEVCPEPIGDILEVSRRILPSATWAGMSWNVTAAWRSWGEAGRRRFGRSPTGWPASSAKRQGRTSRRRRSTKFPRGEGRRDGAENRTCTGGSISSKAPPVLTLPRVFAAVPSGSRAAPVDDQTRAMPVGYLAVRWLLTGFPLTCGQRHRIDHSPSGRKRGRSWY